MLPFSSRIELLILIYVLSYFPQQFLSMSVPWQISYMLLQNYPVCLPCRHASLGFSDFCFQVYGCWISGNINIIELACKYMVYLDCIHLIAEKEHPGYLMSPNVWTELDIPSLNLTLWNSCYPWIPKIDLIIKSVLCVS